MTDRQRPKFSLHRLVDAVLAEAISPEPATVADEVLRRIRKVDQRAALVEALPALVRSQMLFDAPPYEPPGDPALTDQLPDRQSVFGASSERREFDGSWGRAAAMRDWLETLHATSMLGAKERKFLRNFTAEDCYAAAQRRYDSAARMKARADQLSRTGSLIEQYGVEELHELPDAVQRAELRTLREAS